MLNVHNGHLVLEEKGIYSIEKFIVARRLMYWQVYLHKTVVAAEYMLIYTLRRAKELVKNGEVIFASSALKFFLENDIKQENTHGFDENMIREIRIPCQHCFAVIFFIDHQENNHQYYSDNQINTFLKLFG